MAKKKQTNKYPPGWDEQRVKRVIHHYDHQSDEEAIAEDEARVKEDSATTMRVPRSLVARIRSLIARHEREQKKSA